MPLFPVVSKPLTAVKKPPRTLLGRSSSSGEVPPSAFIRTLARKGEAMRFSHYSPFHGKIFLRPDTRVSTSSLIPAKLPSSVLIRNLLKEKFRYEGAPKGLKKQVKLKHKCSSFNVSLDPQSRNKSRDVPSVPHFFAMRKRPSRVSLCPT